MKRQFLKNFLNKISNFPNWMKEIIYIQLSTEIDNNNFAYNFATYSPTLTYKGKCEIELKNSGFDSNIYNIFSAISNNQTISEIALNTYLSMEEVSKYILFGIEQGYIEKPQNTEILNLIEFISGKIRTGEYFANCKSITKDQLTKSIEISTEQKDLKFGQILVNNKLISKENLANVLNLKEESQKRFILDYNELPKIEQPYTNPNSEYLKEIENLQSENRKLKIRQKQLLALIKQSKH